MKLFTAMGAAALLLASAGVLSTPAAQAQRTTAASKTAAPRSSAPQKIVVHLSSSEGEHGLHSAFMAIGLATALKEKGADVTLMLDSTAPNLVRKDWSSKTLAPTTHGATKAATTTMPPMHLGDVLASFVKAGGRILMCPHCTAQCGIVKGGMITGAAVADPGGLAVLVYNADKVVDY